MQRLGEAGLIGNKNNLGGVRTRIAQRLAIGGERGQVAHGDGTAAGLTYAAIFFSVSTGMRSMFGRIRIWCEPTPSLSMALASM